MCPSFKEKISEFADDPKIGAREIMRNNAIRFRKIWIV